MLLGLHEKYTIEGLEQIDDIEDKIAIEILKGSFVNDLCELTNEYTKVNNTLKTYLQKRKEKGVLDHIAFYQSHWGKLSALHCMASINEEAPGITHKNILNWLNFLEYLIFNVDEMILNTKINEFQNILGNQVNELKFKISGLLDTHDVFKAKYRAMGMIIHMIEDSYTLSHCKREGSDIMGFYCYSEQSARVHKKNDFVLSEYEPKMLNDIHNVLTELLNGNSAISNYKEIFKVSNFAVPSSSGGFVQ
jgi:hypothetical protein